MIQHVDPGYQVVSMTSGRWEAVGPTLEVPSDAFVGGWAQIPAGVVVATYAAAAVAGPEAWLLPLD